jgi:N-acetylneuraminate synthase
VVADVRKGDTLSEANIRSIRPGHGLAPKHLYAVLGRSAARDLKRGEPLGWDLIG